VRVGDLLWEPGLRETELRMVDVWVIVALLGVGEAEELKEADLVGANVVEGEKEGLPVALGELEWEKVEDCVRVWDIEMDWLKVRVEGKRPSHQEAAIGIIGACCHIQQFISLFLSRPSSYSTNQPSHHPNKRTQKVEAAEDSDKFF
jgi:hypothetical protein